MILIGNGKVITRDVTDPFIEDGAVCMEGDRILEVGNADQLRKKYKAAEWIDAHGGVIMPGLINAHNHIYSAFARGLSIPGNNPQNFLEILDGTWWTIDRALTLPAVYRSARATYLDCIRNGVTCIFDHHASYGAIEGSLQRITDAAKELGVRTCVAYEISDRDGKEKMKQSVRENVAAMECATKESDGMVKALMGMHASFTLSDETLQYCIHENNGSVGYHIHVAEGAYDEEQCEKQYGMTIVERLHRTGILGSQTIVAHCIYISESDMDILKATDTMVVHNPESNMGNAVGCPDVLTMYDKGILLGLGTDGYTNDMLESMKVANLLQKHGKGNPSVAWNEIPDMLFTNNSKIEGRIFHKDLGVLRKGALADVIVMDYDPLTPMNAHNYNSHILFGMNGKNTITTIINGKVLMKDRVMIGLDEKREMALAREEANGLWKELCL